MAKFINFWNLFSLGRVFQIWKFEITWVDCNQALFFSMIWFSMFSRYYSRETRVKMEEGCEFRQWDELLPDALGLIFRNLSLQEVLTVVPRVCKSWGKAVKGPYCWQEIDIEEWSKNRCPENFDRMLRLLIPRSGGSLRKLCVSGLSDKSSFEFIANKLVYHFHYCSYLFLIEDKHQFKILCLVS